MWLECPPDQIISIEKALYGRLSIFKCQSINMTSDTCNPIDVKNIIEAYCNNKRRCQLDLKNNLLGDICPKVHKYLDIEFKCIQRFALSDPCSGKPCGHGATCRNLYGFPECSCPVGSSGDPKKRCCNKLTCG